MDLIVIRTTKGRTFFSLESESVQTFNQVSEKKFDEFFRTDDIVLHFLSLWMLYSHLYK